MSDIRIAVVTVLYKEKLENTATYKTLLKWLQSPIFVYDNSPQEVSHNVSQNIELILNPTNPGVSKAYNEAANWAKQHNYTHILLTDSDSHFDSNAMEMYETYAKKFKDSILLPNCFSNGKKISPFYFLFGKSFYGNKIKNDKIRLGKILAINSGMLIPISIFNKIGGFNEDLPLDWSDVYFLRQAANLQVKAYNIPLNIEHSLSEHQDSNIASVKQRFSIQNSAISIVANNFLEIGLMKFWQLLKALKLCIKFQSFVFIKLLFRK